MRLGDILVAQGIVTPRDVTEAMELQKTQGGRLGDVLIAAGKLKAVDLEAVMLEAPPIPSSIEDTGLSLTDLLNLAIKTMYSAGLETPSAVAEVLKLPHRIIQQLFEAAKERKLLDVLGAAGLRV